MYNRNIYIFGTDNSTMGDLKLKPSHVLGLIENADIGFVPRVIKDGSIVPI